MVFEPVGGWSVGLRIEVEGAAAAKQLNLRFTWKTARAPRGDISNRLPSFSFVPLSNTSMLVRHSLGHWD